jgi:hypothetical protein
MTDQKIRESQLPTPKSTQIKFSLVKSSMFHLETSSKPFLLTIIP